MLKKLCFLITISLLIATNAEAQNVRGILNQEAPNWGVDEWIQMPDGKSELDVSDFEGKVLYLYCFQSWCPGCHSHGFPTLQQVIDKYGDDSEVGIVTVQTVFEGFHANGPDNARDVAKKYGLQIPVGHSGSPTKRSTVMQNYRTGGTPWTVIIDKDGVVRYNDFHIQPEQAFSLIDTLKKGTPEP